MSILIKGIKIPKNCSDCPLNYDMMSCMITGTRWWSDTLMDFDCQESRLYDCPLVEIPETHGRLIDADELKKTFDIVPAGRVTRASVRTTINHADTIVEAEGVEE